MLAWMNTNPALSETIMLLTSDGVYMCYGFFWVFFLLQ